MSDAQPEMSDNEEHVGLPRISPIATALAPVLTLGMTSAFWFFVVGLGWSAGASAAVLFGAPHLYVAGGAAGIFAVLVAQLAPCANERRLSTSMFSIVFTSAIGVYLSAPVADSISSVIVGLLVGVAAVMSIMYKQAFVPVTVGGACIVSAIGTMLLVGLGTLIAFPVGWPLGGAVCVFALPHLCACFHREPLHEILVGESGEEIQREITVSLWLKRTIPQAFWFNGFGGGWVWKGAIAAALVEVWANWLAVHDAGFQRSAKIAVGAGCWAILTVALVRAGFSERRTRCRVPVCRSPACHRPTPTDLEPDRGDNVSLWPCSPP